MITIDFKQPFDPIDIEDDYSQMTFDSPQTSGINQLILVKISPHPDPHLPNVYNLGFGPPNDDGTFQDNIRLKHSDSNRVFSTVLFLGLIFLQANPDLILGVDGVDDLRATMYHLMFKSNRDYLSNFFVAIGVDWYVRVFRNWSCEVDSSGNLLAKPKPQPFDYDRDRHDLYRYYMFHLR